MNELVNYTTDPWMNYMLNGAFEEAWMVSDIVLKERAGKPCLHLPRHQQYFWDGSSLQNKRVLVRCYHGLGDTIQFIRYMPLVKAIAKEVIVWMQPELIPLFKSMNGIDKLLPLHHGSPDVEYDINVELMELPHIFRTTINTIPAKIPYVYVEPKTLSHNGQFTVGLVWKASDWDKRRNIPFSFLTPSFNLKKIKFYILQQNAKEAGWQEGFGTTIGGDILELAKIICSLDLLISVDSMPAHLAGAMGVPVWNLLHSEADWRWMRDRDDSPWYPTMRLFRQKSNGEWEGVVEQVIIELEKLLLSSKNNFHTSKHQHFFND